MAFRPGVFPSGKITEVVPAGISCGLSLLFAGLMGHDEASGPHPEFVLVDGADAFDPESFTGGACSKMLWIRCTAGLEMLRAADLLVHDGNVPLIMLDATGLDRHELEALPTSAWWRLNHRVKLTGGRMVVITPSPLVPCAGLRLSLSAALSLGDFDKSSEELVDRLQAIPVRLRHAT